MLDRDSVTALARRIAVNAHHAAAHPTSHLGTFEASASANPVAAPFRDPGVASCAEETEAAGQGLVASSGAGWYGTTSTA